MVRIVNRQSRHRKVYFRANSQVNENLLPGKVASKSGLLATLVTSTSGESRNITKELKGGARKEAGTPVKENGELFDRFWTEYPRKVAKQAARKAWSKIKPTQELAETILEAIEHHKLTRQWIKDDGQFIPHPSTFLNQRRWEDQINNEMLFKAKDETEIEAVFEEVVT